MNNRVLGVHSGVTFEGVCMVQMHAQYLLRCEKYALKIYVILSQISCRSACPSSMWCLSVTCQNFITSIALEAQSACNCR